eukprot:TRINITY_DN15089_c0_g3_i1.p2 TRINITY_DN15089_c0_g3~~TRINITY_DN15089_c0_g3_i1.p2  ORF type:complete len:140 (+),score=3.60 TRINITY_DN15089_c0_g3_i1:161-580(+)
MESCEIKFIFERCNQKINPSLLQILAELSKNKNKYHKQQIDEIAVSLCFMEGDIIQQGDVIQYAVIFFDFSCRIKYKKYVKQLVQDRIVLNSFLQESFCLGTCSSSSCCCCHSYLMQIQDAKCEHFLALRYLAKQCKKM